MELVNNTLPERVAEFWDRYWRNFDAVGQNAQGLRADFARSCLGEFIQLEQECLEMQIDQQTAILLHQLGFGLYGDIDDEASALEHLRVILNLLPSDGDNVAEQCFAIQLTVRAHKNSQEELAKTLSFVNVENKSSRGMKELARAIASAIESVCHNEPEAPMSDGLLEELCRFFNLKVDQPEQQTLAGVVRAVGAR